MVVFHSHKHGSKFDKIAVAMGWKERPVARLVIPAENTSALRTEIIRILNKQYTLCQYKLPFSFARQEADTSVGFQDS
jgi:hypothetical protein